MIAFLVSNVKFILSIKKQEKRSHAYNMINFEKISQCGHGDCRIGTISCQNLNSSGVLNRFLSLKLAKQVLLKTCTCYCPWQINLTIDR